MVLRSIYCSKEDITNSTVLLQLEGDGTTARTARTAGNLRIFSIWGQAPAICFEHSGYRIKSKETLQASIYIVSKEDMTTLAF